MLFRTPEDLGFDPNQVTPGWVGFTATALVAGAIILLMLHFFRRVTRINHRAEARERIEAELAERDAASASTGGDAPQGQTADASAGTAGEPGAAAHDDLAADAGESRQPQA